jgi:Ca2+-binding RTX toxin-like protein
VSGSDYTGATGTVTFAAGQATATVTVPITNDTLVESPESFYLHLTGGSNVTIARGSGLGTINSDDAAPPPPPVAPTVTVNDVAINEGAGTLVFTIARSGDLSAASSVNYGTANGTATAGSDYIAATRTVTFAAGQATATVTVQITNDTLIENPETFFLNLTGGTNVTISDRQGVGTINSDDTGTTPLPAGFPTRPTISGTDGNNNINARASTIDYVDAKGGDDVIAGVGSRDYIDGGTGSDTTSYHWSGARVDVNLMRATQRNGDANGDVLVNIENVTGSNGNDLLAGDNGANVLNGLGGQDTLTGRGGSDHFVFDSAVNANRDVVTDFALGGKLDFSLIDANAGLVGNQAFAWLDTGAFSGTAGQLRKYNQNGKHFVAGDTNGDRVADFIVEVAGKTDLTSADILF